MKPKAPKEIISLGIDIGTSTVKFVKLRRAEETIELLDANISPLELDISQILKQFKDTQEALSVVAGLSGPATVLRYVSMPRMNRSELQQALKFEAQKHIPFSVAETNVDAAILKEDLPDNKMLTLIAAVKKEFMNQRLKVFDGAGIRVNIIDLDSLALVNAFSFNYTLEEIKATKAVALINMGATLTNLSIVEANIPRFSRDIQIAGNTFTQKLVETHALEFKAAEEMKLAPDTEGRVAATVESIVTNLAAEIRTSFDFYESQSATAVEKIFLSGGTIHFTGLKEKLAALLGLEVNEWDPLKKIALAPALDAQRIKSLAPQLAVALGLALRK